MLRLCAAYEARDMSVKDPAKKSARLIKVAKEIYYPGAPHGFTAKLQEPGQCRFTDLS